MTANDDSPPTGETVSGEQSFDDDAGARTHQTGSADAQVYVDAGDRGETSLRVKGCWLDDEPGDVTVELGLGHAHVSIGFELSEAEEFAAQLHEAAKFAREGR